MKTFLVLVLVVGVAVSSVSAAPPSSAIPQELLAGILGGGIGFWVGIFIAHDLHLWEPGPLGPLQDPETLACLAVTITAGASIGVITAGTVLGIDGNELLCAGGTLVGTGVGMVLGPILARLFSGDRAEWSIYASAICAGAGAVVGFNIGASER